MVLIMFTPPLGTKSFYKSSPIMMRAYTPLSSFNKVLPVGIWKYTNT